MARPKDDIAGVAVDLAAGQDHLLKLVEQQKQREQQRPNKADNGDKRSAEHANQLSSEPATKQARELTRTRRGRKRPAERIATEARIKETWVTPSFKAKLSRCAEVDRIFYAMRATGEGFRTKQELVDEALAWLVQKYG